MPIERPIIVSGGSPLTIQFVGGWAKVDSTTIATNYPLGTVTSIELTTASSPLRRLNFRNQECQIAIAFAGIDVAIFTGPGGRNLQVATTRPFGQSFFLPKDKNKIQSKLDGAVASLKILKAGDILVNDITPGHIDLFIHYVDAAAAPKIRRKSVGA